MKQTANARSKLLFVGVGTSVLILDQLTKYGVAQAQMVCNQGIAFGFSVQGTVAVTVLITAVILLYGCISRPEEIGYAFVGGGGLSNVLDRGIFGCVRDWLVLPLMPTFNLADVSLTLGVVILLLGIPKTKKAW